MSGEIWILIYEMLFIQQSELDTQSDSIRPNQST